MADKPLKILLIGPTKGGKSSIANFLEGTSATAKVNPDEYHPTVGVRILEFDREINLPGKKSWEGTHRVKVQLWDCSGDRKYEAGWSALYSDARGIIFVISPENRNADKELENWYARFVAPINLKESSCMIFSHNTAGNGSTQQKFKIKLTKNLAKMPLVNTSLDYETDTIKYEFDNLLTSILKDTNDKRDDEELAIING